MKSLLPVVFVVSMIPFSPVHAEVSRCQEATYKGEALARNGKSFEAESVLSQALQICDGSKEKNARPFLAMGRLYISIKRYQDAVRKFEEALKIEPKSHLAWVQLSEAYFELGDFAKAADFGKKAAAVKEKSLAAQGSLMAGKALFALAAARGDLKDQSSESFFKKALELAPNQGESSYFLGVLQETSRKNTIAAKESYAKGCENGSVAACDALSSLASAEPSSKK